MINIKGLSEKHIKKINCFCNDNKNISFISFCCFTECYTNQIGAVFIYRELNAKLFIDRWYTLTIEDLDFCIITKESIESKQKILNISKCYKAIEKTKIININLNDFIKKEYISNKLTLF
jgi:hypothetical protein